MEMVLPYDRSVVPQETSYWCGPASTQMVLNSRGIHRSEGELARRLGTHTGGTDHIGLIARVLNEELEGGYDVRLIPNDPPTQDQVELLWNDVVRSVNAGYGVVDNIMVPPSNYPRGSNGSYSPAYGGGFVYHYRAVMGYADTVNGRHLWIADSGFSPFGYWNTLEQSASMIAGKGYACKPVGDSEPQRSVPAIFHIDKRTREVEQQLLGSTGHGWPSLGGRSVVDAVAAIMEELNKPKGCEP